MMMALHLARSIDFAATAAFSGISLAAVWAPRHINFEPVRQPLGFGCLATAALAVPAHAALLCLQASEMLDRPLTELGLDNLLAVATQTRFGQVWLAQSLLLSVALIMRAISELRLLPALIGLAVSSCAPFSGHVFAGDMAAPAMIANVIHVAIAAAWFAGLPALLIVGAFADKADFVRALSAFSRFALPAMLTLLISGAGLAVANLGSWPALFATPYGQLLTVKLLFLVCVLIWAATIRRIIATAPGASVVPAIAYRPLLGEFLAANALVVVAVSLAQTSPGRHQPIDWPFSFRLAPALAWRAPNTDRYRLIGLCLIPMVGVIGGVVLHAFSRSRVALLLAFGAVASGIPLASRELAVEAYPTTYRTSPISFEAREISAAIPVFAQHCSPCHGVTGRGDGAAGSVLSPPPSNLTEPHAGDHTPGDVYWWLTHGRPRSGMPGFEGAITEADRWRLIQYVRALSWGYQGRLIGRFAVRDQPWLPAIDIRFDRTADASLLDERESRAKLLVFVNARQQLDRLHALFTSAEQVGSHGGTIVVVVAPQLAGLVHYPRTAVGWLLVVDEDRTIADAWSLYRRTLAHPDFDDALRHPPAVEFLVDRFGFVRARWRSDEAGATKGIPNLLEQINALNRESEVRSREDHVH
jgi:putative copper resistance protein D